jgi:acetylornithine aminotransferase/acetylornithine/N-succinyldiaminopimelate aminotransferase
MHGTTFGGGPLACAVALQLITLLERGKVLKHVQEVGKYLVQKLNDLQHKYEVIHEVRGLGLMIGMELESADLAKAIVQQMMERGVILNRTDETVVRFLPPYIIKKQHVDTALRELEQVLEKNAKVKTHHGDTEALRKHGENQFHRKGR